MKPTCKDKYGELKLKERIKERTNWKSEKREKNKVLLKSIYLLFKVWRYQRSISQIDRKVIAKKSRKTKTDCNCTCKET